MLGVQVRNEFPSLFSDPSTPLNPQNAEAFCSDRERTQQSSSSVLQGLFPPGSGRTLSEDADRQWPAWTTDWRGWTRCLST